MLATAAEAATGEARLELARRAASLTEGRDDAADLLASLVLARALLEAGEAAEAHERLAHAQATLAANRELRHDPELILAAVETLARRRLRRRRALPRAPRRGDRRGACARRRRAAEGPAPDGLAGLRGRTLDGRVAQLLRGGAPCRRDRSGARAHRRHRRERADRRSPRPRDGRANGRGAAERRRRSSRAHPRAGRAREPATPTPRSRSSRRPPPIRRRRSCSAACPHPTSTSRRPTCAPAGGRRQRPRRRAARRRRGLGTCAARGRARRSPRRDEHVAERPFLLARVRLNLGEHLRREGSRREARDELRAALAVFEQLDAEPWSERARRELRASGETARRRRAEHDGRADAAGAPDRPHGRGGREPEGGRRHALPQPEDDRVPPRQGLPQARDHVRPPAPTPPRASRNCSRCRDAARSHARS